MRTSRKFQAAGIAAAIALGSLIPAAPANANFIKNAIRSSLEKQLQKNPGQISNPAFQLQAISVDLAIPATLRLNQNKGKNSWAPSSSKISFDIGPTLGLGVKEATLYGHQSLKLRLGWPLGTIKMEIPAQAGGNLTPGGRGLNAAPVSLFQNPAIADNTFANGGCSDFAVGGLDNPATPQAGLDTPEAAAAWAANGGNATFNRTAPLSLQVPNAVHGSANLFNSQLAPFDLTTRMNFANVIRKNFGADNCRQEWTGSTQTDVTVHLAGSMALAPGLTKDLKLKLANLKLATPAGKETQVTLPACMTPFKYYTATVGSKTATPQPTEPCGADGSQIPASQGGNPANNGMNGIGLVPVPAKASVSQLSGELLIG